MGAPPLPDFAAIEAAARRLAGRCERTPLVPFLHATSGRRVLLKLENRQTTRSFKARGAQNCALKASESTKLPGLITFSSGNHGQATALAAERLGLSCTVVCPTDLREGKRRAMERLGAECLLHGRTSAERHERALEVAAERGLFLIPPYDHEDVIAGQGTVGLELAEQAGELALVVVPVGGGGLISGIATALEVLRPGLAVWGVEPVDADDARRSLAAGRLESNRHPSQSACDGLRNTRLGELNFRVISQRVAGIAAVPDDEVLEAAALIDAAGLGPVEPSGAIALAAVLFGRLPLPEAPIACVVSGGNT